MHAADRPCLPATALHRRVAVALLGSLGALLGLLVLAGWYLHWTALIQLRPTQAPMQYNTALCLLLAGIALGGWAWGKTPRAVSPLGGLVALCGGLTMAEYLFSFNLGIDQLLFRSYITTETSQAGRMSPVASLCFTLTGVALLLLGRRLPPRWCPWSIGALGSVVISICTVALLGYAFGLPGTYGWGQLTRIAPLTAGGFALLGTGLFTAAWHLSVQPGERTPRWLPGPLALGVFTGSLVLCFALESKQDQEIEQTVRVGAESAKSLIGVRMDGRIRSLARLTRRWEFSGAPEQTAWEAEAADYVRDFPDLQALEWIDATHRVRWVIPLSGNEGKLNLDLTQEEHRKAAVERAEREHKPVVTTIVSLFRGGRGFIVYAPITVNGKSQGLIAAVFNAEACLQRYLPPVVAAGEAIRCSQGGDVFYERNAEVPPTRKNWIVHDRIELRGATWDLHVWPTPALTARLDSPLPKVVLCAGALGALLLGAVCYFAQRSSRQASETARANSALQSALDEVKTLEGLFPICSCCKRVRDDSGYWNQIETYLHRHTNASFSHGYCPECAAKTCLEFGIAIPEAVQAEFKAGNFELPVRAAEKKPAAEA